jgi:chromosome segregation ATPase
MTYHNRCKCVTGPNFRYESVICAVHGVIDDKRKSNCLNHPEGGKDHLFRFCYCDIDGKDAEIDHLTKENSELSAKCDHYLDECGRMEGEIERLSKQGALMATTVREYMQNSVDLKRQIVDLETVNDRLTAELAVKTEALSSILKATVDTKINLPRNLIDALIIGEVALTPSKAVEEMMGRVEAGKVCAEALKARLNVWTRETYIQAEEAISFAREKGLIQ